MSSTGMHGCMHARLHASAAVPVKAGGGRGGWPTVSGWSSPNAAKPHGICVEDECQLAHYHRQRLVAHRHIILCALYTRHGVQAARPLVRSCLGWRAGSPPPPSFRRIHNSDAVRKPVHTQLVISPSLQPALGGTTVGGVLLPQGLWPDAELPQHRTEQSRALSFLASTSLTTRSYSALAARSLSLDASTLFKYSRFKRCHSPCCSRGRASTQASSSHRSSQHAAAHCALCAAIADS